MHKLPQVLLLVINNYDVIIILGLRLLGIGRNEYIELMNRSRSNRGRLFGKRNVRGLLPNVPSDVYIAPWWRVEVGMVLEDDIKASTIISQIS